MAFTVSFLKFLSTIAREAVIIKGTAGESVEACCSTPSLCDWCVVWIVVRVVVVFITAMSVVSSSLDVFLFLNLVLDEGLVVNSHLRSFLEILSSTSWAPCLQFFLTTASTSIFFTAMFHVVLHSSLQIIISKYFSNIWVHFKIAFPVTITQIFVSVIYWHLFWLFCFFFNYFWFEFLLNLIKEWWLIRGRELLSFKNSLAVSESKSLVLLFVVS